MSFPNLELILSWQQNKMYSPVATSRKSGNLTVLPLNDLEMIF